MWSDSFSLRMRFVRLVCFNWTVSLCVYRAEPGPISCREVEHRAESLGPRGQGAEGTGWWPHTGSDSQGLSAGRAQGATRRGRSVTEDQKLGAGGGSEREDQVFSQPERITTHPRALLIDMFSRNVFRLSLICICMTFVLVNEDAAVLFVMTGSCRTTVMGAVCTLRLYRHCRSDSERPRRLWTESRTATDRCRSVTRFMHMTCYHRILIILVSSNTRWTSCSLIRDLK